MEDELSFSGVTDRSVMKFWSLFAVGQRIGYHERKRKWYNNPIFYFPPSFRYTLSFQIFFVLQWRLKCRIFLNCEQC